MPSDTRRLCAGVGAFCSGPTDPHVSAQTKESVWKSEVVSPIVTATAAFLAFLHVTLEEEGSQRS